MAVATLGGTVLGDGKLRRSEDFLKRLGWKLYA